MRSEEAERRCVAYDDRPEAWCKSFSEGEKKKKRRQRGVALHMINAPWLGNTFFLFSFVPRDDAYFSGGDAAPRGLVYFFLLVLFLFAFFVVHEEAMHMTSTPGFGVNLFFPFIFSLVFL